MSCDLCQASGPTTEFSIWYARASELLGASEQRPALYSRQVRMCDACFSGEAARFRRLARRAARIGGAVTAGLTLMVVLAAELASASTSRLGIGPTLLVGTLFGLFAGASMAGAIYLGFAQRRAPRRLVFGLVQTHADHLGLSGCVGF